MYAFNEEVGSEFFYSLGEALRAAQGFMEAFELTFHGDWDYTLAILEGEGRHFYIAPGGTFLQPDVPDTTCNWWNRGALLYRYERLRGALELHAENTQRLRLAVRPAPERIQ